MTRAVNPGVAGLVVGALVMVLVGMLPGGDEIHLLSGLVCGFVAFVKTGGK
jgi:hypothetical protein